MHSNYPSFAIPDYKPNIASLDANQRELTKHGTDEFPCACYIDTLNDNAFPWHWHDELELGFVLQGDITISINTQRYVISEGDGVFVNSGVLHSFSSSGPVEGLLPLVVFQPSLVYGSKSTVFWKKYLQPLTEAVNFSHAVLKSSVPWQKQTVEEIKKIYQLFLSAEPGFEFRVKNSLTESLYQFCMHCSDLLNTDSARNSTEINRLRQMLDFIQCHYMEPIQLQQIADSAAISQRECLRCFQAIIGISPKRYVTDLRIQKAKELLCGSSLSLLEICECCGFQSQSYFTKTFRKIVGCAPGQYRKK